MNGITPMDTRPLWVVSVISNPVRFRSRYALYRQFEERVLKAGANLLTVELALGGRKFEVTNEGHVRHLQLRARDEIWHKENMINLGIQCLPEDWQYVAWIDADISFMRDDWVQEIIQQLQRYKIVQCFRDAIDLGPSGEFLARHSGFAWSFVAGEPMGTPGRYGYLGHPGFAWACRREVFNDLGGLFDVGILGSGDHHMAWALVGQACDNSPKLSRGYREALKTWEARATARVRQDVGFVPGSIAHHWHGRKRDRKYQDRWQIIHQYKYDPEFDLQRDWQGVYQLSDRGERLRNPIRGYFNARNEDSVDL